MEGEGQQGQRTHRRRRADREGGRKALAPAEQRAALGQTRLQERIQAGLDGRREEKEGRHGREAELEGDVAQQGRIEAGHDSCCQAQGGEPRAGASAEAGREEEGAHDGGPDHRRRHAAQEGVEPQGRQRHEEVPPASAQRCAGDGQRQAQEDSHVQPGDGEQVPCPGLQEVLAHAVRDVAPEAEQHGLGQRGVGLGQGLLQRIGQALPQCVDLAQRPRALLLLHQRGAGEGHHRRDALARQVLSIVEVGEAGRRLQSTLEEQNVSVAEVGGLSLADERGVGPQRDQHPVRESGVRVGRAWAGLPPRRHLQPVGGARLHRVAHDLGLERDALRRKRV